MVNQLSKEKNKNRKEKNKIVKPACNLKTTEINGSFPKVSVDQSENLLLAYRNENQLTLEDIQHTLKLFIGEGVTNIRVFDDGRLVHSNLYSGNEAMKVYEDLSKKNLLKSQVFMSFNSPKVEARMNLKDSDIESIDFIMIDCDPERESGISSTENEKNEAAEMANTIRTYLHEKGVVNVILCDSGNGYHLMIPTKSIDPKYAKTLVKPILTGLASRFSTSTVKVDTVTSNPSRLTKLYGSIACKGEASKERPYRKSKILSEPISDERNSMNVLQNLLNDLSTAMTSKSDEVLDLPKSNERDVIPNVDAEKWVASFGIPYTVKAGVNKNYTLYIFDRCPLRNHTTNTNGSSVIQTAQEGVKFSCLHESCKDKSVFDVLEHYPIPDEAKITTKRQLLPSIDITKLKSGKIYKLPQNYILTNEGVFTEGKKILSPVFINAITHDLETNKITYLLTYKVGNRYLTKDFSGYFLNDFNLKKLAEFGIDVSPKYDTEALNYILMQKGGVKTTFLTNRLGWQDNRFQLHQSYHYDENQDESQYQGLFDFHPLGSFDEWKQMVNDSMLGSPMEIILSIGFSSVVLGFLKRHSYPDLTCPVINLYGKTSTSKSTSLQAIASIFGNATKSILTFNDTQNALLKSLEGNYGVPQCIDELSSSRVSDISSLIYQFSSGQSKRRLTGSSEFRDVSEFGTVIVTTSEVSITSKLNLNAGLRVRTLEFPQVIWSRDAETAEKIKYVSHLNRGQAGARFIEELVKREDMLIVNLFEETKQELLKSMPDSPTKDRVVVYLAAIVTAGKLVKELIGIDLDIPYIEAFLIKNEQASVNARNLITHSTESRIYETLIRNAHRFKGSGRYVPSWGWFKMFKGRGHVFIFPSAFEELLMGALKIEDPSAVVKELIDKEIILTEQGRRTKRKKLEEEVITVYDIVIPQDYIHYFTDETSLNFTQPTLTTNRKKNDSIYNDDICQNIEEDF